MMDRTNRRDDGPPRMAMRPLVPPPDGWTLMEAAEALCPREARLYKEGGPALDAAMGVDKKGKRDSGGSPKIWLSKRLLAPLAKRPDLALTGRDVARHIRDGRSTLERDIIHGALRDDPTPFDQCEIDQHDLNRVETRVGLGFRAGTAHVERSLTRTLFTETSRVTLIEVRVEAATSAIAEAALQAKRELRDAGIGAPIKPEYSRDRCRIWCQWRVESWPEGEPPPSIEECLAAAREHFAGDIPREEFRAIRREVVPPEWQKPGPRGPRN